MNSDTLRWFETFLATPGLPSLGPDPRGSRESLRELNRKLDETFRKTKVAAGKELLIRSLLLLWHDHLDESHSLSQEIHTADGSLLHGIMHRREPDYWNAKYWFNRVGDHPTFPLIAKRTSELLKTRDETLRGELMPQGKWNPGSLVDACERAVNGESLLVATLQAVQEIEFRVLLEHFCQELP